MEEERHDRVSETDDVRDLRNDPRVTGMRKGRGVTRTSCQRKAPELARK